MNIKKIKNFEFKNPVLALVILCVLIGIVIGLIL